MSTKRHGSVKRSEGEAGAILPLVLVFAAIGTLLMTALVAWAGTNIRISREAYYREEAFQIAEAGVEYYRWHLAHAPQDFADGTGTSSPSAHDFYDADGIKIGTFTLTITPPPVGSTIVTVRSEGRTALYPSIRRTLQVKLAIPSLAKYSIASDDDVRFGEGTEVYGPIHSNGGIRFDGVAHNLVTSAKSTYTDPDSGNNEYAVHTEVSPSDASPPAALKTRSDVFVAGRQFPVPAYDFSSLTTDLATIKTNAQASGRYIGPSGKQGYRIVLKTNDTFDLYKVNSLASAPNGCSNSLNQSGWGTWSIATGGSAQTFVANYAFPANGLLFVEDNAWVEGQIASARLTIAAARFPANSATWASITVNNSVLYTNYDGTDALALIAQNNINAGLSSLDTLRIDAALVAQNGRAGRYYYGSSCGSAYVRSSLTLYGMIASNQRYGFAYTNGTGYDARTIIYDANLLYGPPPSFPLTSDQYSVVSWQELK